MSEQDGDFELPIAEFQEGNPARAFWTWYRLRIQPRLDPAELPREGSAVLAVDAAKKQLGENDRAVVKFVELFSWMKLGGLRGFGG